MIERAATRTREPRTSRARARRVAAIALVVIGLVAAVAALDAVVLYNRIERVAFRPPPDRPGTTFLLLGSDSRGFVTTEADRRSFGHVPGERADVVLVVHVPDEGDPVMLAVPRDLLVFADNAVVRRLNVTMLGAGPQGTADALCASLGIAVDHVAVVGFSGFRSLVDSVGGVEVTTDLPTRDVYTGLALEAGTQHLDGNQALAFVRSRHQEALVDGAWSPVNDGAATRPERATQVLRDVGSAAKGRAWNPVVAHRIASTLASSVRIDATMGPAELTELGAAVRSLQHGSDRSLVLPAVTSATAVPVAEIASNAGEVLARLGVDQVPVDPGTCAPMLLTARRAGPLAAPGADGQ